MTHDRINPSVFRTRVLLDPNFHPSGLLVAEAHGNLVGYVLSTAETLALHRVWMGRLDLSGAISDGLIQVDGPPELARAFPTWLALDLFAGIPPVAPNSHQ